MMAPVRSPDLDPLVDPDRPALMSREDLDHYIALSKGNPPLIFDTWNGYPHAREDLLADLQEYATNPIVLSGDLHTSMASNLIPKGSKVPVAVELMTTSVTSPGFTEYLPERRPGAMRDATCEINPFVKYMETDRRGWLAITLSNNDCIAEWHLLDGVKSARYESSVDRRLTIRAGEVRVGLREA